MALVTLDEVRAQLRLEEGEEDLLLSSLVATAAAHIEKEYGIVAAERTEEFTFDGFGPALVIPRRPAALDQVTVHYLDGSGTEVELGAVRTFRRGGWTYVAPAAGAAFPSTASAPGSVTVTATIGFPAEGGSADASFAAARLAALVLVTHLFEYRDGGEQIPETVDLLLDGFRFRGA